MANGRINGRSSGTRRIAARTTGVMPAQIHHEAMNAAANRPMYACTSGDTGYSRTVAAPVSSPGIVHPASERSAARIRFTARIYRTALTRASLVANRGPVQRATRTGACRALPSARMTHKRMLVGTSLLSVLLLSFHLTPDALHAKPRSFEAGPGNLTAILILLVLLSGPALLAERRSGRLIMLLAALFAMGMPILHFTLRADLTKYSGAFFFVWGMIALGVNGLFSVLLWVSELSRMRDERRQRDPLSAA